MTTKKHRLAAKLSTSTILLLCTLGAVAGVCPFATGHWMDDYGYEWNVSQNGFGILSGTVRVWNSGCAELEWSVTGTSYFNGQFNVTASNPVAEEFCTTWFSYFGYIEQPGCNTGSGDWSNGWSEAGFWSWSKPCEVPSGETTHFDGWHPSFPTLANFSMTLSGSRMWGRTVTEGVGPGGSGDSCWFAQSQFPPQTTISGGTWVADAAQAWGADSIGWPPQMITYYRGQNRAPCGFSWGQRMYIACAESPDPSYKDNILVATIGVSTITVSRDGVPATKTY